MRKNIITGLLIVSYAFATAQDSLNSAKSYFNASLNFINNSVYYGRKDSIATPYLTPSIGYYHRSGFFIEGSFSYLVSTGNSRVDLSTIGAGYDFNIGNFQGEIAAEKFFYNSNSTNVKAEVLGDISAMALYDFGFMETFLQSGINFGNKNDYWLSWGIDHRFTLADEKLEITPSFVFNSTTRNLYASYFGNRRFRPKKNGIQPPTVTATLQDASKLSLQNYEFSLPFSYTVKKFTLGITPYYSIPANPAVVTIKINPVIGPTQTRIITEKTENIFYFSLDAAIKF